MFALLAFLGFFVLPQVLFLMSIIPIPNVKAEEIREWVRYATHLRDWVWEHEKEYHQLQYNPAGPATTEIMNPLELLNRTIEESSRHTLLTEMRKTLMKVVGKFDSIQIWFRRFDLLIG
jgi:hypothetical protein